MIVQSLPGGTDAACLCQQGIVSVDRMNVQRNVGRVNGEVAVHGRLQLAVGDTRYGLHVLPEDAVMQNKQVCAQNQGLMDGSFRAVHGNGYF